MLFRSFINFKAVIFIQLKKKQKLRNDQLIIEIIIIKIIKISIIIRCFDFIIKLTDAEKIMYFVIVVIIRFTTN